MTGRRPLWLILAGALALCAVVLAASLPENGRNAEAAPELILRYAENQPEGYPTTQAAYAFADLVAQQTGGRVQV